jgi:hypothetical protein
MYRKEDVIHFKEGEDEQLYKGNSSNLKGIG